LDLPASTKRIVPWRSFFTKIQIMKKVIPFLCVVFLLMSSGCKDDESPKECDIPTPSNMSVDCVEEATDTSLNGWTQHFYPDGQNPESEGNYTDGLRAGYWKFFYENGQVSRDGNYTEGMTNGFFNVYFESGNIREAGHYDQCEKEGFWNYHYDNDANQVQISGTYQDDEPVGIWREFDEDGNEINTYDCQ